MRAASPSWRGRGPEPPPPPWYPTITPYLSRIGVAGAWPTAELRPAFTVRSATSFSRASARFFRGWNSPRQRASFNDRDCADATELRFMNAVLLGPSY